MSILPVISKILEKLLVVTHPNDTSHESVSVEVPMWLLKGIQCSALPSCHVQEVEESS